MSSFRALFEVIVAEGLFGSLYADRASHQHEYRARVQRGEGGGARAARVSMRARMAAITCGSVMIAGIRNAAPQRGHWLMSLSNTPQTLHPGHRCPGARRCRFAALPASSC